MRPQQPRNVKEVLIAILIGAGVSFFTVLFDGLADLLRDHSEQITASLTAMGYYLAKMYRA